MRGAWSVFVKATKRALNHIQNITARKKNTFFFIPTTTRLCMQKKQVLRTSLLWAKRILFVKQNLKTKQSIKTKRITFVGPRKHGVAVEKNP
jgi:hypothetical protein